MTLLTLISIMFCLGILVASADGGNAEEITRIESELKTKIAELIIAVAEEKGVDANLALKVAHCESGLNYKAVGDQGKSYGVWQIYLPAHPNVPKEFAVNPITSTDWAISHLADGKWGMWSCFKLIT